MNRLYTLLINLCVKGLKPVSEEEPYWQDTEYYDVYLELNRLVPDVSKKKELK